MPKSKVYDYLDTLGIAYKIIEHPPVFTCDDANQFWRELRGAHCKNLFVRNRNGDQHFLISTLADKKVDLQALRRLPELECSKLSFGSPKRLKDRLDLTPGSVSPFGLLNDPKGDVHYYIDAELMNAAYVNFHPNLNDATIEITPADFKTFIESLGRKLIAIDIPVLVD